VGDYLKLVLLGGGLVFLGGGVLLHEWSNRRRAKRLLATRPALDPAAFGRAYFGQSGPRAALAAQVRDVLAEHVPYKLDGLGPDDAFVRDLRMDELDSMSTVELVLSLEKRFAIDIPDEDAQKILTFRELVDYLEPRVPEGRLFSGSERAGEQADGADGRQGPSWAPPPAGWTP
jgi:acyl carrier protein